MKRTTFLEKRITCEYSGTPLYELLVYYFFAMQTSSMGTVLSRYTNFFFSNDQHENRYGSKEQRENKMFLLFFL